MIKDELYQYMMTIEEKEKWTIHDSRKYWFEYEIQALSKVFDFD